LGARPAKGASQRWFAEDERLREDVDDAEDEEAAAEVEDAGDVAVESGDGVVVEGMLAVPREEEGWRRSVYMRRL
jgi:hypothetical protein